MEMSTAIRIGLAVRSRCVIASLARDMRSPAPMALMSLAECQHLSIITPEEAANRNDELMCWVYSPFGQGYIYIPEHALTQESPCYQLQNYAIYKTQKQLLRLAMWFWRRAGELVGDEVVRCK